MATLLSILAAVVFMVTGSNYTYEYCELKKFDTQADEAYEIVVNEFCKEGYEDITVLRFGENDYMCKGHEYGEYCDRTYYVVFECWNGKVNIVKERDVRVTDGYEPKVLERYWYGGHPADAWVLVEEDI